MRVCLVSLCMTLKTSLYVILFSEFCLLSPIKHYENIPVSSTIPILTLFSYCIFFMLYALLHIYFFNTHLLYECFLFCYLNFLCSLLIYASAPDWHLFSVLFIFIICLIYFIHLIEETYEVDSDRESSNVQYHRAVTQQVLVQPSNKQMKWDKMLHLPACKYDAI